jgi:hypothetical protein
MRDPRRSSVGAMLWGIRMNLTQQVTQEQPRVRHLIVNGALNPGNSGGPLIDRSTGNVVSIVVEKWALFSPDVEKVIFALQHSPIRMGRSLAYTDASGNQRELSNEEITAAALQEIYTKSQVMIGEAISVSELNSFIREKSRLWPVRVSADFAFSSYHSFVVEDCEMAPSSAIQKECERLGTATQCHGCRPFCRAENLTGSCLIEEYPIRSAAPHVSTT